MAHLSPRLLTQLKHTHLIVVPVTPDTQGIINLADHLTNLAAQRMIVNPAMRLLALLPTRVIANRKAHKQRLADVDTIARGQRPPLRVLPYIPERMHIQGYELRRPDYTKQAEEMLTHAEVIAVPTFAHG